MMTRRERPGGGRRPGRRRPRGSEGSGVRPERSPPTRPAPARGRRCAGSAADGHAVELGVGDELLGVAVHAVLGDVEAGQLGLRADAQPDRLRDRVPGAEAEREDEREHDDHAERLVAELRERARVHEAAVRVADPRVLREPRRGEEAAGERAPDARDAVRGEHADRVVELAVDQQDARHDDQAADEADDRRRPVLDVARAGRDRDEAGDQAVADHADVDRALQHDGRDVGAEDAARTRRASSPSRPRRSARRSRPAWSRR